MKPQYDNIITACADAVEIAARSALLAESLAKQAGMLISMRLGLIVAQLNDLQRDAEALVQQSKQPVAATIANADPAFLDSMPPGQRRLYNQARQRGYVQPFGNTTLIAEKMVEIGYFEVADAKMGSFRIKPIPLDVANVLFALPKYERNMLDIVMMCTPFETRTPSETETCRRLVDKGVLEYDQAKARFSVAPKFREFA